MKIKEFYRPIIQTFGLEHFQKYHNSHYQPLYNAYSAPHRAYHNLDHITNVVRGAGFSAGAAWWNNKEKSEDVKKVVLAAYYHDYCNNVRSSAKFARSQVKLMKDLPEGSAKFVFDAIRATRLHITDNPLIQKLIDADLAIFRARRNEYIDYMLKIRMEYSNISDTEYIEKRTKVLKYYLELFRNNKRLTLDQRKEYTDNIIFELDVLFYATSDSRKLISVLSELNELANGHYKNVIRLGGKHGD